MSSFNLESLLYIYWSWVFRNVEELLTRLNLVPGTGNRKLERIYQKHQFYHVVVEIISRERDESLLLDALRNKRSFQLRVLSEIPVSVSQDFLCTKYIVFHENSLNGFAQQSNYELENMRPDLCKRIKWEVPQFRHRFSQSRNFQLV